MQTPLCDLHPRGLFVVCALLMLASCREGEDHSRSETSQAVSQEAEIQAFWNWFERNCERVGRDAADPDVFAEVSQRVQELGESLEVEIAIAKSPKELVISAGGLKGNRQLVEKIVALAPPEIDGWRIVAFRQPKPEVLTYNYESATLSVKDVKFVASKTGEFTDLVIYIEGLDGGVRDSLVGCTFLMLDGQIGELNVMTKVGAIDFEPMTAAPSSAKPMTEIGDVIL